MIRTKKEINFFHKQSKGKHNRLVSLSAFFYFLSKSNSLKRRKAVNKMEEKIRTMEHEGMPVYHLADCIKLIGKGNPSAVKKRIDTDEIMLLEYQGKGQPVNFITEKGIGIMEEFYSVEKGEWLNLFRENSAKIFEKVKSDEVSLVPAEEEMLSLLTTINFYGHELSIYGTLENPLFVASEVAEMIDYGKTSGGSYDVNTMVRSIDREEKEVRTITVPNGKSLSTTLLTEDGFYEVLLLSRKPVAKELKKKVKEVLKALRIKGRYEVEGHPALKNNASQIEIDRSRARTLELEKEAEVIRQRTLEMKERIEYHKYLEEKFSSLPKGPTRKKLENEALNILYGKEIIPETRTPDRKSYKSAELGRILKSKYGLKEVPSAQTIGTITSKYNLKTYEYAWKDTVEINNHEVDCWHYFENVIEKIYEIICKDDKYKDRYIKNMQGKLF